MSDFVKDKVVVVTGSGAGIGRDFALQFAANGAKVVVNDLGRNAETGEFAAQRVVAEIKEAGGQAVASTDSVAEWDSAQKIVQAALDTFGRIDCVVNNAGIVRDRMFFNMSLDEWKAVVDVHLNGSFFVARAAAPHFKAQNGGSFVHMTSTSGLIGNIGQANYSAAKMGIVGLSRSIALDMMAFNVRSNCISPFAWTRMIGTIPADTEAQKARLERSKKMTPAKIAPMAVFLLSDAAEGISSQIFGVRMNEIMLFNANRPVRSVHNSEGWTLEAIAEHAVPSMKPFFIDMKRSPEYFTWDPV